jgi:hypothetical protein
MRDDKNMTAWSAEDALWLEGEAERREERLAKEADDVRRAGMHDEPVAAITERHDKAMAEIQKYIHEACKPFHHQPLTPDLKAKVREALTKTLASVPLPKGGDGLRIGDNWAAGAAHAWEFDGGDIAKDVGEVGGQDAVVVKPKAGPWTTDDDGDPIRYWEDSDDAAFAFGGCDGWWWFAWHPRTTEGQGRGDAATKPEAMAAADAWLAEQGYGLEPERASPKATPWDSAGGTTTRRQWTIGDGSAADVHAFRDHAEWYAWHYPGTLGAIAFASGKEETAQAAREAADAALRAAGYGLECEVSDGQTTETQHKWRQEIDTWDAEEGSQS